MDALSLFFAEVEKTVIAVSRGSDAASQLKSLASQQSELRNLFEQLQRRPDAAKANAAHIKKAASIRNEQIFRITWRGGGATEHVKGWTALALKLNLKERTIGVYLSQGRGAFSILRTNPVTGEPDQLTITRLAPVAAPKRAVGRPPKHKAVAARLGTEFALSAKSVPKTRNRRTDEKSRGDV